VFTEAHRLEPGRPEILRALAGSQMNLGRFNDAISSYQQCLARSPADAELYASLAACHFMVMELEGAVTNYRQALALATEGRYLDGLAAAFCQQGRLEEAVAAHREALRLSPENARYHSNFLLTLQYLAEITPDSLLLKHRSWASMHESDNTPPAGFSNPPDPERRLKIGYVSPDFRTHSVAYFFEGLLRSHDNKVVETFCYAVKPHRDETTVRLQRESSAWRDVSTMDDAALVEQVRADGIDILVDLAGHTAGNRLTVFAARAAPVQVTYLGYPSTTGLSRMDYRLTDERADPPGEEAFYSEHLVRLPECFLCYQPLHQSPPVASAPMVHNGFITFGSFNNLAKINANVVALWSEILQAVPDSRLLIKNPSLTDIATAERYRAMFGTHGIAAERIELLGLVLDQQAHLDTYRRIDIALDTFPYNGTTTTCEALYMGVPVITLAGQAHAGRVGLSLLGSLGLEELIVRTPVDYVSCAVSLAMNPGRISELRHMLRERLLTSVICDADSFARKVEQAFRQIWRDWCSTQTT
jgi:predicted O-linked N-acetylglucosamine transferase (SPINDLY family)